MIGKDIIFKNIFILVLIAVVILLTAGVSLADSPQFRLDIDSLNLEKGVSANLVFSVVNGRGAEVAGILGLDDFDLISKSHSTSTQIINGDASYQDNYNYIIMPKKRGQFTLQGRIKYNGKIYTTNQLQINVSQGNKANEDEVKNLFIKTILSNNEIYLGEKIVLGYELYSRYNIQDFGFRDQVNIDEFVSQSISRDKLKANYTYLNGNKYVRYEAKQFYLSPIKTGDFTIPSYDFQVNVSTSNFFDSAKAVFLKTESKKIKVKPLPLKNKPTNFSGIVGGKLNLKAEYSKNEVKYGDSLTLHVTAAGNCNLDSLKEIVPDNIAGFSVYQTVKNKKESIKDGRYHAEKEFDVILVPEKNGNINIRPMDISYFDTQSGSYKKIQIPGKTIKVTGKIPPSQDQSEVKKKTAAVKTVLINQINYKPDNKNYLTIRVKRSHFFTGLLVFIIFLIIIVLVVYLISHRKSHDKKLQHIYKELRNETDEDRIYNLLNSMIKYRFGFSLKANSRDMIRKHLDDQELINLILEVMDYMENRKYKGHNSELDLRAKIANIYKKLK